jgi:hypothetical protein
MKRLLYLLVPIAILLALIGPGCYTIIQHPAGYDGARASQTSDCVSCHADYQQFPYGYYYSPYPSFWWDYPSYSSYYAYPWWWTYYQNVSSDQGSGGNSDDQETSADRGTKFDRRAGHGLPLPPPYSYPSDNNLGGWPSGPSIYNLPGGTGTSGSGTTGSGKSTTESRGKDQNSTTTGDGKEVRQSNQGQSTDNQSKPDDSKPKDKPKETQNVKKPRH